MTSSPAATEASATWEPMKPAPPVTQMTAMESDPSSHGDARVLRPLERAFYQRPTEAVALDLLGKLLVRATPEGTVTVRLTEVEAYLGTDDPACHTFGGRRTPRVETMWGEAGHAYVYLVYGMHHCLNVVTVGPGTPQAVLVRAAVPVTGEQLIRTRRRRPDPASRLLDGPGKLCQGLGITRRDDGADLCETRSGLWITDDGVRPTSEAVRRLPRIGVDYAGEAARWLLRFRWT